MALSAQTALFLSQLGQILTLIENTSEGAVAYKLIPASFYHNGQEFPYEVREELKASGLRRVKEEGLEYYLVPEKSASNSNGKLSHYAQQTPGLPATYAQPEEAPAIQPDASETPEVVKRYVAAAEKEADKAAPKKPAAKRTRTIKKIEE